MATDRTVRPKHFRDEHSYASWFFRILLLLGQEVMCAWKPQCFIREECKRWSKGWFCRGMKGRVWILRKGLDWGVNHLNILRVRHRDKKIKWIELRWRYRSMVHASTTGMDHGMISSTESKSISWIGKLQREISLIRRVSIHEAWRWKHEQWNNPMSGAWIWWRRTSLPKQWKHRSGQASLVVSWTSS